MQNIRTGEALERAPLLILVGFLALCLLTGGGSRPDVQSHLILRPAAIVVCMIALAFANGWQIRPLIAPLSFLFVLALIMALQLIPLPPSIWTQLPGREIYAQIASAAGFEQPWRPISLAPSRTWNSLMSLLPPLAAILMFALVRPRLRQWVLISLIVLLFVSAILGMAQIMGPPEGALYFYRVTNNGSAVGFFANRNHQAMMLACLFPMLAVFSSAPAKNAGFDRFRQWASLGVGLLLIPLLLVTGSRAGLGLAVVGIMAAFALYRRPQGDGAVRERGPYRWRRRRTIGIFAGAAAASLLVGATLFAAKADAIYRLFDSDSVELRFQLLPSLWQLASSYFPIGAGFGSFDSVYRVIEPFDLLQRGYVNHAHNDLAQIVIEAGLAGALLVLAFLAWWMLRSIKVWRAPIVPGGGVQMGRLGSVLILILLLGSVVDYPLRTPFVMVVFALAAAWLSFSLRPPGRETEAGRAPA